MRCASRHLLILSLAALAFPLNAFGRTDEDKTGKDEPHLSIRTGLPCSQCHVNRTGGGARTAFGSIYAQTRLPMRQSVFRGRFLNSFLSVGADARIATEVTSGDSPDTGFGVEEANLYLEARVVPDVLTVYIDQTVGPGSATTREVFGLVGLSSDVYVKAGKFLLPYGLRLQDDAAFVRQQTGFTFDTPDVGVEVGFEPGPLSVFASVTNGTQGAAENNDDKQVTASAALIFPSFRVGASGSHNDAPGSSRDVFGGFAGLGLGRVTILGEVDYIFDTFDTGADSNQFAAYIEGDVLIARGINLKATYGFLDPDRDIAENARTRVRFGVELFPVPFLRIAALYTMLEDIPQATTDRDRLTIELHGFF